ncbi:hypothetical protein STRDD10_01039 [Streptococcus sp. DD10]|nr:hypothetical protein STRDD10_01039 [Streptococcus sp. DD10]
MITALEIYQKIIGLFCGLLFLIICTLCLWGIQYVKLSDK